MSQPRPASETPAERGRRLVKMAVPFYAGMAALGWVWRSGVRGESLLTAPGASGAVAGSSAELIGLGLGLGLAIVAVSALWTALWPSGEALSRFLGETIGEIGLVQCTLLAAVSGFAEEALFRGALQPEFGLVVTSILFGAMHLVPRWPFVLWSVYAVAVGLVLGFAFDHTGSLWPPVIAHMVVNGINLPLLSRRYGRGSSFDLQTGTSSETGSAGDDGDGVHLDEGTER